MKRAPLKRTRRKAPTAAERRHLARVAAMPCLVSGKTPVTIHHVTSDGFKRIARSHTRIVPLAAEYHLIQWGPKGSVEALGHAGFKREYGIDLLAVADKLWQDSVALECGHYVAMEAANG